MQTAATLAKIRRYLRHYPADARALATLGSRLGRFGWPVTSARGFEQIFLALHRRLPDAAETAFYLDQIRRRRLSPLALTLSFLMMPEKLERHLLGGTLTEAHHQARLALIGQLPQASVIIDLGGACIQDPRGSLLYMGYAHRPERIEILDLAPEERHWHRPEHRHDRDLVAEGTRIRYHYQPLWNLSPFEDASVDGVWSGQSIEHVSHSNARVAIREAWRVLRPGGWFALDTPNRALTRLLVKEDFVHPEHQYEYEPAELAAMLEAQGFRIDKQLAVSPMPFSRRSGRFSRLELLEAQGLSRDPEIGFSFFLLASKPA